MERIYYVYVYMDTNKFGSYYYEGLDFSFLYEPFYIGKGKRRRYLNHLNENNLNRNTFLNNKLKKLLKLGLEPFIIKLYENLTEEEAYNIEIDLISKIGKRSEMKGPLTNLSDGGGGSPMKGKYHANWGKKLKDSTKKKISEKLKLNNPMRNPEVAEKVRLSNLGREPWNKGKSEDRPDVIQKMSQKKIKYKNIKSISKLTNEVIEFNNTNEVIKFLNKTHRMIMIYFEKGESKDYYWEFDKIDTNK
jgi:hypothetical protein